MQAGRSQVSISDALAEASGAKSNCLPGGPECFIAGTLVQTEQGSKPVENITATDKVWSRNPDTGKTELKPVVRTFAKTVYETGMVALSDAKTSKQVAPVTGTLSYPFFTTDGVVALGDLGIGTEILTRAGPCLVVQSVTVEQHPEGVAVYNFEVEDDHTYFVGTAGGGAWVHNDCLPGMNLNDIMGETGLIPTQTDVNAGNINEYAEAMRNGTWDWEKTRTTVRESMILDSEGRIAAGHHRFIAAEIAGVKIPNGVVKRLSRPTTRPIYSWVDVLVKPGHR